MVPLLFPGIPGGVELLVILLVMMFLLVVPGVLILGAYFVGKRRGGSADTSTDDADR